jgi:hypothetical protein
MGNTRRIHSKKKTQKDPIIHSLNGRIRHFERLLYHNGKPIIVKRDQLWSLCITYFTRVVLAAFFLQNPGISCHHVNRLFAVADFEFGVDV